MCEEDVPLPHGARQQSHIYWQQIIYQTSVYEMTSYILHARKRGDPMSVEQEQDAQTHSSPKVVLERMIQATNRHEMGAIVSSFAPDFRSQHAVHPQMAVTVQAD